jgi:hypothetical protein
MTRTKTQTLSFLAFALCLLLGFWLSFQSPVEAQSGPSTNGRLAAAQDAVALEVRGYGSVGVQVTGTFVGTVTFEATVDGVTWVAFNMTPSNSGTDASTLATTGASRKDCGGYRAVRARMSAYTSGTAIVTIQGATS